MVSQWLDYTKKYGLGYKLTTGQYGVLFNDHTSMLSSTLDENIILMVDHKSGLIDQFRADFLP